MNNITIEDLLSLIREYNSEEEEIIKRAYEYAKTLHEGQIRQSGEPYITHPLNVAYILAQMHADRDTVCAGLLHDTLEDTNIAKEDIAENFNASIALLVEGVTKISKMNFSSKSEMNYANTRKIITQITTDVRIIIIKLADRLHNMRTLQYKTEFKQKENSLETMEIFVPLAYYIGAYRIKSELEDLSLKYLEPESYKKISEIRNKQQENSYKCLKEMQDNIDNTFKENNIYNESKIRIKNIYGIYKRILEGDKICDIHDLFSIKIMVKEIMDCYQGLCLVHQKYNPINDRFKDYIWNPKTNMYKSLHTTVFGEDEKLVQLQLRTIDMDKIASFGLTAYWDINKGQARNIMQEDLRQKFQFYNSLIEIDSMFRDNQDFIQQVKTELFSPNVYVYGKNGDIIELPQGSTIVDFAYKISSDLGNTMITATANDKVVPFNYVLQNKDRIKIITNDLSYGPRDEWLDYAYTSHAKRKILDFKK